MYRVNKLFCKIESCESVSEQDGKVLVNEANNAWVWRDRKGNYIDYVDTYEGGLETLRNYWRLRRDSYQNLVRYAEEKLEQAEVLRDER